MSAANRSPSPDEDQREQARSERHENVLIDAGAGTGKTTLLVKRLVRLVAPNGDEPPLELDRVAVVTFTRRAAGELRLRIREELLRELSAAEISEHRRGRLYAALGKLDTAYVGTIHSFADRLLRHHPVEAKLSPSYEIAEDSEALVRETFDLLQLGVETGTLAVSLGPSDASARGAEAEQTILEALRAGVRAQSEELEFFTRYGLDAMVEGFIRHRDRPPVDPPLLEFDAAAFRRYADELVALVRPVHGTSRGAKWLRDIAERVGALRDEQDPAVLLSQLGPEFYGWKDAQKKAQFDDDPIAWKVHKALYDKTSKKPPRVPPLRDDLLAPMQRRLAARLVRIFPVVIALYEKVKARRHAVDEIDLLLKLRDLLADDRSVRASCQALFDHIFVDEFQDTDPLQAEILLFLCEEGAVASRAEDVVIARGRLTVVGDPKQSIYRFRRADIAMYEDVRRRIASGAHLAVSLSANFRSDPSLIDWFNHRFTEVLGPPGPDGESVFDGALGTVSYQPFQKVGSASSAVTVRAIHLIPDPEASGYPDRRALEAEALARYLRHLVTRAGVHVRDPLDDRLRPLEYGDIAILALETTNLGLLFPELDRMGVPYTARGGTLFLSDETHRQFLLGLRAIANRDDGIAEAALLRPPFFALDLVDLLHLRSADRASSQAAGVRARAALAQVHELRRRRFERSPGATARDLLEETGFGRTVALGPNGLQRLDRLRELCLVLEQTAANEGLDYDGVTARMRDWVMAPVALDPPPPVGTHAVQILTVHQAKGLEFPVVVLWDSCAGWVGRADHGPWRVARDGGAWELALDRLGWEEPPERGLLEEEKAYREAERKRMVYVAATRARDLLILPLAEGRRGQPAITACLLDGDPGPMVQREEPYGAGAGAPWSLGLEEPALRALVSDAGFEAELGARWGAAATEAGRARFAPSAVTAVAHARAPVILPGSEGVDGEGELEVSRKWRPGRHGPVFGDAVHKAIGLALHGHTAEAAVRRAASEVGLEEHLGEAAEDVARALDALRGEQLDGSAAGVLRVEYPIAGAANGKLLVGYIDLVHANDASLSVIDFKTDTPIAGPPEETHPEYVEQVRSYARLLEAAGVCAGKRVRCGLLFTADGGVRWVKTETPPLRTNTLGTAG